MKYLCCNSTIFYQQDKKGLISKIKALITKLSQKNKEPVDPHKLEREVCTDKLNALENCLAECHGLMLGIRPERIKLEKKVEGKKYDKCIIVKPTVCELLGGEYNIHFTFCGKNMVGQIDAKEKVSIQDEIVVKLSFEDFYIFDPITGDVIG